MSEKFYPHYLVQREKHPDIITIGGSEELVTGTLLAIIYLTSKDPGSFGMGVDALIITTEEFLKNVEEFISQNKRKTDNTTVKIVKSLELGSAAEEFIEDLDLDEDD